MNIFRNIMTVDIKKSYVELTVIRKDSDMFEMNLTASNGDFKGSTQVYDQFITLADFATQLTHFPKTSKILFYEAGVKDSYAYYSMRFYTLGVSGIICVEINIESNVATE